VSLPAGYARRPATWEDIEPVAALVKACDLADAGVVDPVREHIEEDWRTGDLDRHTALAFAADGELAGLAQVFGFNPDLSLDLWIRVHPRHRGRGLGSGLLSWAEDRAGELAPAGARPKLYNSVPAEDVAGARLLVARGYEPVRVFWHMERAFDGPVEPPLVPEGIHVRSYRDETDADPVYAALEEAFADHWGYEPYPREAHRERFERIDRGLVWVALAGEETAGALVARSLEGSGWVDDVGVRRPWRGRGIARVLLLTSFAELAARGLPSVALNVDSENRTGATRLYESVGMRVRRAWDVYEKAPAADIS
jgi:mycothiol synthase